jgi:mannose-1-phosphate guanylyltransferase/mannose-1-phosphate guanylyltransferase/mannose-6-phosphate isomerase
MILPVILSGGAGSRLWPLSTRAAPKQLLPLLGTHTMIQDTAARFTGDNFLDPAFICSAAHADIIAAQVPGTGALLLEPVGRNTAPAAAAAALHGQAIGAELVLLAPADHHVRNVPAFQNAARDAAPAALAGNIVTFGITPDRPETGYGYIHMGESVSGAVRRVQAFVEKPDHATAQTYLADGGYAWNAGLFLFRPDTMLAELKTHAPDILASVEAAYALAKVEGRKVALDVDSFAACRSDSIDYAVMEATTHAACLPVDIGWSDIGSFEALHGDLPKDAQGNAGPEDMSLIESTDCLVSSDGPKVSLVGVEGLGVIVKNGEVLVVKLSESQSVKSLVEHLKSTDQTTRL